MIVFKKDIFIFQKCKWVDDLNCLRKTKDYDSLSNVKEQMTLIVFARQKTMIVFKK